VITDGGIEAHPFENLPCLLAWTNAVIWVDIPSCDGDAVRVLADVFGFHALAVRDCVERNRVPKVHAYADHLFIVLHTPEHGQRGHVHYIELDQFIGANYLVTVHGPVNAAVHGDVALRETRSVLARINAGRLHPATPFDLSHAIVSALARSQEAYVKTVTTDVWRLEQRVTGGSVGDPEALLNELFRARHGLLAVRTMGALGSETYGRITKLRHIPVDAQQSVGDIADQFDHIHDLQNPSEYPRPTATGHAGHGRHRRFCRWRSGLTAPSASGTVRAGRIATTEPAGAEPSTPASNPVRCRRWQRTGPAETGPPWPLASRGRVRSAGKASAR
jgi:Mg2+ and Co2+ transporter CorA